MKYITLITLAAACLIPSKMSAEPDIQTTWEFVLSTKDETLVQELPQALSGDYQALSLPGIKMSEEQLTARNIIFATITSSSVTSHMNGAIRKVESIAKYTTESGLEAYALKLEENRVVTIEPLDTEGRYKLTETSAALPSGFGASKAICKIMQ